MILKLGPASDTECETIFSELNLKYMQYIFFVCDKEYSVMNKYLPPPMYEHSEHLY